MKSNYSSVRSHEDSTVEVTLQNVCAHENITVKTSINTYARGRTLVHYNTEYADYYISLLLL